MYDLEFPENATEVMKRIDETFHGIELLDNAGREQVMQMLGGWILVGKFGADGKKVLVAFDKYCVSECLMEDEKWQVPGR